MWRFRRPAFIDCDHGDRDKYRPGRSRDICSVRRARVLLTDGPHLGDAVTTTGCCRVLGARRVHTRRRRNDVYARGVAQPRDAPPVARPLERSRRRRRRTLGTGIRRCAVLCRTLRLRAERERGREGGGTIRASRPMRTNARSHRHGRTWSGHLRRRDNNDIILVPRPAGRNVLRSVSPTVRGVRGFVFFFFFSLSYASSSTTRQHEPEDGRGVDPPLPPPRHLKRPVWVDRYVAPCGRFCSTTLPVPSRPTGFGFFPRPSVRRFAFPHEPHDGRCGAEEGDCF